MSFKSAGIVSLLLFASLATAQYTINSGSNPPPSGTEPWRGILDYTRAIDWRNAGVKINGVLGIPTYTYTCATIVPTGLRNWQPNHAYAPGQQIADSRGNVETVQAPGGTSGPTEPLNGSPNAANSWPIVNNTLFTETQPATGAVTWLMTTGDQPPMTDTAKVTNAIIKCSQYVQANSLPGGIVTLAAGDFYLTAGLNWNVGAQYPQNSPFPTLNGPISGVLLRGQGPMQTTLHVTDEGQCSSDICVISYPATFTNYAAGGSLGSSINPGSAAVWMGSGQFQGTYNKGDTQLIAGFWTPAGTEPQKGDVLFLDQNNDAFSICPATPPTGQTPPGNCQLAGIPGATASGSTATIVTSVAHGFSVGQCVGIGDVGINPSTTATQANGTIAFNTGANPDKTNNCGKRSVDDGTNQPPYLPAWWQVTHVGCIQSQAFVDVSLCGANAIINAFQFNAGQTSVNCPTATPNCLDPNGGGQVTADTGGVLLSSVDGVTMTCCANPSQNARLCPPGPNSPNPSCLIQQGEISIRSQLEVKLITAVTPAGTGTCPPAPVHVCYTIDPPLYMNNWRASQRPGMWWSGHKNMGDGLEGFTYLTEHNFGDGHVGGIQFINAYNGWVRNVRALQINRNFVWSDRSGRIEAVDNYIGGTRGGASTAYVFEAYSTADDLMMNNICEHTVSCFMTSSVMGRVTAYNYMVDSGYTVNFDWLMPLMTMNHLAAFYNLFEGNDSAGIHTDNLHGTAGVSTMFRQRSRGQDLPTKNTNRNGLSSWSFNRGLNFVGVVIGWPQAQIHYLDNTQAAASGNLDQAIFGFGKWKQNIQAFGNDHLATASSLRWGNYDAVTGTTRWCGTGTEGPPNCGCGSAAVNNYCPANGLRDSAEIPTQGSEFLSPNAIPASHTLPASFFLSSPPPFWTTSWGTPGWPAIGPDVNAAGSSLDTTCPNPIDPTVVGTGPGTFSQCDGIGDHAYQIPSQVCYNHLAVDTAWNDAMIGKLGQEVFAVTGAVQTGTGNSGLVTLTANNDLQTSKNLTTGVTFTYTIQVTGINPSGYNGTFQVHSATPTTITYWLPNNPGTYIGGGQATTPNFKQFDARQCYPQEFGLSTNVTDNNYYDNPDGSCRNMGTGIDGPAALPSKCYYTALVNTPSPGATFWVCPTGQTTGPCATATYHTIQAAFNDIASGVIPCGSTVKIASTSDGTPAGTWDIWQETNLTYPAVACNAQNWMTIETGQVSSLPPEGTTVSPGWLNTASLPSRPAYNQPATLGIYMPKIMNTAYGQPALSFATVTSTSGPVPSYVRFIGLNFVQPGPGAFCPTGRDCQTGWQNSIVESGCFGVGVLCPDHIIFDRVIVGPDDLTGNSTVSVCTGIRLTGTNMAVVDSYVYEIAGIVGSCSESHGIGLGNANGGQQGPYKIVNNFIEGGSENIFFGGGHSVSIPSNVQIRRNHLYKPANLWRPGNPGYLGTPIGIKNLVEIKNVQQALIEGNIHENSWYGHDSNGTFVSDQQGFGLLLNASSTPGDAQSSVVQDVTVRYNVIRHTVRGMFIDSEDCTTKTAGSCGTYPPGTNDPPSLTQRISAHDNLLDDISAKYAADGNPNSSLGSGVDGSGLSTGNGMQSVPPTGIFNSLTFDHNTVISNSFRQNLTVSSITVSGTTATLTATTASTAISVNQRVAVFGACPGFNWTNVLVASVVQTSPVLIFTYTTGATGTCNQGFVSTLGSVVGGAVNLNESAGDNPIVNVSESGNLAQALLSDIQEFQFCVAAGTPTGCTTAATFSLYGLTGTLACYNNNQTAAACPGSGTPATWTLAGLVKCTGAGTGNVFGNASATACTANGQGIVTWTHPMTGLPAANANAKAYQSYWGNSGPNPNPQWQNVTVTNNIFSGKVQQPSGICWNGSSATSNGVLTSCGVLATTGTGAYNYNCNVQASQQLTGQGLSGDTLPTGTSDTTDHALETVGFQNYNSDNLGQGVVNLGDLALASSSPFITGVPGCGGDGKPSGANIGLIQQYTSGVQ